MTQRTELQQERADIVSVYELAEATHRAGAAVEEALQDARTRIGSRTLPADASESVTREIEAERALQVGLVGRVSEDPPDQDARKRPIQWLLGIARKRLAGS